MELVLSAPCSQRAAAVIVRWVSQLGSGSLQAPTANAGRSWLFRLGLYELTRPKEAADDWVWLVDHTVQLGAHKGLVIVGLRLGDWQANPRPLAHQDMQLLHLQPMEHSTGESMRQALSEVAVRTGIPRQIVSDGGGDVKKGIELFRQAHPQVTATYDFTHKAALLLQKELAANADWDDFVAQSNLARRGLTLTTAGFLVPPALQRKARYMNVDCLVIWGQKVLAYLKRLRRSRRERASLGAPEVRRIEARLGWLRHYRRQLREWMALLALIRTTEHYVRWRGWHATAVEELRACLAALARCPRSRRFQDRLLQFAAQQTAAAQPGERLLGSTEVLESIIGKYKRMQVLHSAWGMTRTILAIGAMVARRCLTTLRQALEHVTNHHVHDWCRKHLGPTLQARRRYALQPEQKPPPNVLTPTGSF